METSYGEPWCQGDFDIVIKMDISRIIERKNFLLRHCIGSYGHRQNRDCGQVLGNASAKPSSYARIGAIFLISRVGGPKEHSRDFHQPLNSSTPSPKQIRSQLIEVQRAMGFEYNNGKAWDAFAGGETREAPDSKVVLI